MKNIVIILKNTIIELVWTFSPDCFFVVFFWKKGIELESWSVGDVWTTKHYAQKTSTLKFEHILLFDNLWLMGTRSYSKTLYALQLAARNDIVQTAPTSWYTKGVFLNSEEQGGKVVATSFCTAFHFIRVNPLPAICFARFCLGRTRTRKDWARVNGRLYPFAK